MATKSPYQRVQDALLDAHARRLAVIPGPNKKGPSASELEFWLVNKPDPGRLVIIQKWTGDHSVGGFDAYFQQIEHKTTPAIAEIVDGPAASPETQAALEAATHLAEKLAAAKTINANLLDPLKRLLKLDNDVTKGAPFWTDQWHTAKKKAQAAIDSSTTPPEPSINAKLLAALESAMPIIENAAGATGNEDIEERCRKAIDSARETLPQFNGLDVMAAARAYPRLVDALKDSMTDEGAAGRKPHLANQRLNHITATAAELLRELGELQ